MSEPRITRVRPADTGDIATEIPDGLPPRLKSMDDIAAVCEAAGLDRLTGEDVHPDAWVTPDCKVGVAVSGISGVSIGGIHVQRALRGWDDVEPQQLVSVQRFAESAFLWTAIRLAIETARAAESGGA